MVKLNTSFLFGHKEVVEILLAFWTTFAFDWIWDTLLYSKSSFESFLAIFPNLICVHQHNNMISKDTNKQSNKNKIYKLIVVKKRKYQDYNEYAYYNKYIITGMYCKKIGKIYNKISYNSIDTIYMHWAIFIISKK